MKLAFTNVSLRHNSTVLFKSGYDLKWSSHLD